MTTRTKVAVAHVRWMVRRDIPAVIAVDAASGVETTDVEVEYQLKRRDTIGKIADAPRFGDPWFFSARPSHFLTRRAVS